MCRSDLPNLSQPLNEGGNFKSLITCIFPNLPNIPNLFAFSPYARASVCVKTKNIVGKVGKVGKAVDCKGFFLPNLVSRLGKVGKLGGCRG
jgi:hypothetical protein